MNDGCVYTHSVLSILHDTLTKHVSKNNRIDCCGKKNMETFSGASVCKRFDGGGPGILSPIPRRSFSSALEKMRRAAPGGPLLSVGELIWWGEVFKNWKTKTD